MIENTKGMTGLSISTRAAASTLTSQSPSTSRPARTWNKGPRSRLDRPAGPPAVGAIDLLRVALWFGLATGLLELGLLLVLKWLRDPSLGFFRMNRHAVWMVPTADLALFVTAGALLAAIGRSRPGLARKLSVPLFGYLAFLVLLLSYHPLHGGASVVLAGGLAYRLARRIARHGPRFQALVRRTSPALGLIAIGMAGVSFYKNVLMERPVPAARAPAPAGAPNVLLIVMDTVRADRLSLSGSSRPTTPNLERIARRGARFTQARSTAPWTLPSHSSIMTGRWPHELNADFDGPLDARWPTLAEFLTSHGYATAGFVANLIYTSAESGLARGFAHYDDHDVSLAAICRSSALGRRVLGAFLDGDGVHVAHPHELLRRKNAAEVGNELLGWLERQPNDRPFFAFLNLFDAHNPYLPPESFPSRFGGRPRSEAERKLLLDWFIRDKKTISPRQSQLAKNAYDDCIAYTDEQIGILMDELAQRGRLENTLVIITADHGEHLGEHALYGHASSLYDQELHVPLLIVPPRGLAEGRAVDTVVSLRDLARTVVDVAGLGRERKSEHERGSESEPMGGRTTFGPFPGRSLARFWARRDGNEPAADDVVLSEVKQPAQSAPNQGRSPVFRGSMQALFTEGKAYIHNGDGVEELYDLASDPNESNDLAGAPEAAPLLNRFRSLLAAPARGDNAPARAAASQEQDRVAKRHPLP